MVLIYFDYVPLDTKNGAKQMPATKQETTAGLMLRIITALNDSRENLERLELGLEAAQIKLGSTEKGHTPNIDSQKLEYAEGDFMRARDLVSDAIRTMCEVMNSPQQVARLSKFVDGELIH